MLSIPQEFIQKIPTFFKRKYYILILLIVFGWCVASRIFFVSKTFMDSDGARIAFGISNLIRGMRFQDASLFHPAKQAGYHYFIYLLQKMMFGEQLFHLKDLINYTSAIFGIGILFVSYFLFSRFVSKSWALLGTFFLSLMPGLWITSLFGNTAIPAVFFFMLSLYLFIVLGKADNPLLMSVPAIVLLIAILFRMDMILTLPCFIVYQLLYERGKIRRLLLFLLILVGIALLVYGFVIPRDTLFGGFFAMHSIGMALVLFGCFAVFALSPIIFVLAMIGLGFSIRSNLKLFLFLFSLAIPVIVFYVCLGFLCKPRQVLPVYPPAALLVCLAVREVYLRLRHKGRYLSDVSVLIIVLLSVSPAFFSFSLDRGGFHITWGSKMTYPTADGYYPFGGALSFAKQVHTGMLDIVHDELHTVVDNFAQSVQSPVYFVCTLSNLYLWYHLLAYHDYTFDGYDFQKGQTIIRTIYTNKQVLEALMNKRGSRVLITNKTLVNIGKYHKDFLDSITLRRMTEPSEFTLYEVTSKANCNDAYHEKLLGEFTNFHNKILVDELDVGNSLSEAKHNYRAEGTTSIEPKSLPMSNNEKIILTDSGKIGKNEEFDVSVEKLKDLFIIKRTDCSVEKQTIWIYVDGVKVKEWNITSSEKLSNSDCFRDISIQIPGKYLTSQKIKIRFVNQSKSNVTSYAYWFYQRLGSDVLYDLVYAVNGL